MNSKFLPPLTLISPIAPVSPTRTPAILNHLTLRLKKVKPIISVNRGVREFRIPAKELVRLLKSKANIIIVDTQPADGYEMWHIPTAVNIPYVSTANPTDRELMLMALPGDRPIVIYCLCEEGTDSAKMALELNRLGYRDNQVRVLEGGLVSWDEKGYPMFKQKIPE